MSGWNLPEKEEDWSTLDTSVPEPPPSAPAEILPDPMEKTVLVDVAKEVEDARSGAEKPKPYQKRVVEGIKDFAPPVDVYEPGFRSDVAEALVKYFQDKKKTENRNAELRKKLGLRG